MFDFVFTDTGFAATEVAVKAVSERGREFFGRTFGHGAVGATLKKSGAYEIMAAMAAAGYTYTVNDKIEAAA